MAISAPEQERKLEVHGVPKPKGHGYLKEVRVDAARAAIQHLQTQKEKQDFAAAKARGITPQEILAQGKKTLDMPRVRKGNE